MRHDGYSSDWYSLKVDSVVDRELTSAWRESEPSILDGDFRWLSNQIKLQNRITITANSGERERGSQVLSRTYRFSLTGPKQKQHSYGCDRITKHRSHMKELHTVVGVRS